MKHTLAVVPLLLGLGLAPLHAEDAVPAVPKDAAYVLPDGRIALHGDAALAPLIDALDAEFAKTHRGIAFAPVLKGSATAVPALAAGATPIGFTIGDAMAPDRRAFRAINKNDPVAIAIAYAGYGPRDGGRTPPAVYVNSANPLKGLTMAQLAGLFTSGAPSGDLNLWSQLGLTGALATRRIHLYGLRDDGDFATTLRLTRLGGMPFAGHYEPLPDEAAVLQAVAQDSYGIAIIGWRDQAPAQEAVRMVPLAQAAGQPFVLPDKDSVAKGAYPLKPQVTLYIGRRGKQPLEPLVKDYVALALSDAGQAIIARFAGDSTGFLPLSADDLKKARETFKE